MAEHIDGNISYSEYIAENLDNIIGILYIKDLLDYMLNNENWELEKILRPAVFTQVPNFHYWAYNPINL